MDSIKSARSVVPSLHVALVAMPWQIFNRPSIQLATLKAYLRKNADFIKVETFHPYLEVAHELGGDTYHWISQNVWVGEALYAAILFQEQRGVAQKLVEKAIRKAGNKIRFDFNDVVLALQDHLDRRISNQDWQDFDLIGFSVCFNQLLSSLAAAKAVKENYPDLPIVFGGSTCAPATGSSLLENFSQIDYAICGEGEKPLLNLCEFLAAKTGTLASEILHAGGKHQASGRDARAGQLDDLSNLPLPDYRDYFAEMNAVFADEPFIPELPIEFSRGCWWGKCAFCNLNVQWCGYRFKKGEQMLSEVLALSEKYGLLDFSFTDNALPVKDSISFFGKLAEQKRDFRFFAEIRIPRQSEDLSIYKNGGLDTVQVGIESLSNGLLKRMRKGSTVIENIAVMRNFLSIGIKLEGNLIIEFPGSTKSEADETFENLDFVMPFSPLSTAVFFLGHGSLVDQTPKQFGIRAIVHHPQNKNLFPPEILKNLVLIIKDYRGGRLKQKKLWAPVVAKVKQWQNFHQQRRSSAREKPLLSYRDGGNFLVVRQELPGRKALHHRLRGQSRQIYLACERICVFEELKQRFPGIPADRLLKFLEDLVQKRLMFAQDKQYLSLAIHTK